MPKVGKKKFPYTKKGKAAARRANQLRLKKQWKEKVIKLKSRKTKKETNLFLICVMNGFKKIFGKGYK